MKDLKGKVATYLAVSPPLGEVLMEKIKKIPMVGDIVLGPDYAAIFSVSKDKIFIESRSNHEHSEFTEIMIKKILELMNEEDLTKYYPG